MQRTVNLGKIIHLRRLPSNVEPTPAHRATAALQPYLHVIDNDKKFCPMAFNQSRMNSLNRQWLSLAHRYYPQSYPQ
jgi:hypothetical protein